MSRVLLLVVAVFVGLKSGKTERRSSIIQYLNHVNGLGVALSLRCAGAWATLGQNDRPSRLGARRECGTGTR